MLEELRALVTEYSHRAASIAYQGGSGNALASVVEAAISRFNASTSERALGLDTQRRRLEARIQLLDRPGPVRRVLSAVMRWRLAAIHADLAAMDATFTAARESVSAELQAAFDEARIHVTFLDEHPPETLSRRAA